MEIVDSLGQSGQIADIVTQEFSPDLVQRVSGAFQQAESKDKQQQMLIRALLPYLNPKRRARLEHAMQLSHISRLAGVALRNGTQINATAQEDLNV